MDYVRVPWVAAEARPSTRPDGQVRRLAPMLAGSLCLCLAAATCGGSATEEPTSMPARGVRSTVPGHRITRVQIQRTQSPAFGGHEFGAAGKYEILVGRAYGALDPNHPLNSGIVNLGRAFRNADGMVEYSSDFYILKPTDASRGNGTLFYDVPNRGNKLGLRLFQGGATNSPKTAADMGNAFLLNQGYTVVWSGWQGNLRPGSDRLTAQLPVATQPDGSPIRRWITTEFTFTAPAYSVSFEGASSTPYRAVEESMPDAKLYRRTGAHAPHELIPRESWSFATCDGSVPAVASNGDVCLPDGFSTDFVYDLVYEAQDPIVMGIGFAAVRDFVSFLRHDPSEANPLALPNGAPDRGAIRWTIMFGTSQSGRFVRDFIYQGFNEDTAGRRVFDGAIPHAAGSVRTFTNAEFAMPGRFPMSVQNHFVPGDQFPFSYATTTDPVTGHADSLLERCRDSQTCPNIMQLDSATEAWAGRSSLIVTDPLGMMDLQLPDNVRVYQFASVQHLHSSLYPDIGAICQQTAKNPNSFLELQRALLVAMQEWVVNGTPPPASAYPRVADGTLVPSLPQSEQGFPDIPGVRYTGLVNDLAVNDHATLPWRHTEDTYVVLVPKVDSDGNDLAGLPSVMTKVPIGTYAGWNVRRAGFMEGEGCYPAGMFVPFAKTAAERGADPRPSLEQRYGTHTRYVEQVRSEAGRLQHAGFLLQEDAEQLISEAENRDLGLPPG